MIDRVARARIDIDAARLIVCNAAIVIDEKGAKGALLEIAEAKILVPQTLLDVIDKAIQAYGGAGVCQDTPLANMYALGRTMRIVDGPDEVHLQQVGRNENKRGQATVDKIARQQKRTEELMKQYGVKTTDNLELNRQSSGQSKLPKLSKL